MQTQRLFCTFRLDGRLFGVDILEVKEVTAATTYTHVAHAPDEVLGLANIRGHIYLALDLRRLLGMPATNVTIDSRLLLFKPSVGSAFGVVVDEISEIQAADTNRIEPFTRNDRETAGTSVQRIDLIDSVCRLPGELLVVLNPRRFLLVVEQNLAVTT
jgi:purine-binding chemotaxis protein CheW